MGPFGLLRQTGLAVSPNDPKVERRQTVQLGEPPPASLVRSPTITLDLEQLGAEG